jgi:hypothetical protein
MSTYNHTIAINPKLIAHADSSDKTDQTLQPREVLVPELSGSDVVLKRRQVICSASYHAPLPIGGGNNHSWKFTQSSTTGGTVTLGAVYIGGVAKTVSSFPGSGTLSGVTTTTLYWVVIDFSAATAAWDSGSTLPTNTATVEYWHVLTLTCAASVISAIFQPWCSDIRALLNP